MEDQKKLFLVDAMAIIYRAFYALNKNPRLNTKGLNTSAILGFANALWSVITTEKPTHLAVACDSQAPTFRHTDYEQYKANRQAMPEEIAAAIPWIDKLLEAWRIPIIRKEGYEADDIIGTLARRAEEEGYTVYMMSSDKDLGQLITEKVLMYRPGKMGDAAEVWGIREICEKFGVSEPKQIIDLLGLWGDSSDNIPGIPGVGEKTAKTLLQQFSSVEDMIAHADEIKNQKLQDKVKEHAEQALFSKQLATIVTDVPLEVNIADLQMQLPDEKALKAVLDELEFRQLAQRIFTTLSLKKKDTGQMSLFSEPVQMGLFEETSTLKTIKDIEHKYHLVTTPEEARQLAGLLNKAPSFCFDTETTGLDANASELVGISFAINPGEAWFVAVPDNHEEAEAMVKIFQEPFANTKVEKVAQNLKYDMLILKWYGLEIVGPMFDTMIAHYLLQPELRHNMDVLAEQYLSYSPIPIERLIGKSGRNQLTMRQAYKQDPQLVADYACEDADVTLRLKSIFEPMLKDTGVQPLFTDIEMPLVTVLASMEQEGVNIDTIALKDFSSDLSSKMKYIEEEIFNISGKPFNISSPKQLGEILFEDLNISSSTVKKTKTGQYSTGEEVLQKLQSSHPIVGKILDYRSLSKLKSTYADALPLLINPRDHRVHTSYNQTVAATGRLSSTNPNLQNIPIRTELGREIRKAFIPRGEGYTLLAADYSQIELRIIAHISGDTGMKEDFIKGIDIHTATASRVFDTPLDKVDREQRRMAKMVNFGIIYGMSAFGLSERLGIGRKEAATIIEQYFEKYPGIKAYMDAQISFAREQGYVETLMGRRRYLPEINARNANIRSFAERNAINAPIQGSAADLIKMAMINIWKELESRKLASKMILQVHDELVFDVVETELKELEAMVREKMEQALELSVPLVVDINTGANWLEAH